MATVGGGVTQTGSSVVNGATLTVANGGTIVNDTILAGGSAVISVGGVDNGSTISNGGYEMVLGTTSGDQIFGTQVVSAATAVVTSETVFAGGTVDLYLAGVIANNLTVNSGGTVVISGHAIANNTVISGGLIELDSPKAVLSGGVTFEGTSGEIEILVAPTTSAGYQNLEIVSGFVNGDIIDDTAAALGTYVTSSISTSGGNTVAVISGSLGSETFTFAGTLVSSTLVVQSDGNGGQEIVACYLPGTLIGTPDGETAIEALSIGDLVLTASGAVEAIRWIGQRSFAGRFIAGKSNVLPICIRADALADGIPRRDLWVSPEHAMLLDGVLVPAGQLVNGVSIIQAERVEEVSYIHLELAHHDVILAEGAASETFVNDDCRTIFHNAAEYDARYPNARPVPAAYCAPRVTQGFALQAIRQRLDERAGVRILLANAAA